VSCRACLDVVEKRKNSLPLPGIESVSSSITSEIPVCSRMKDSAPATYFCIVRNCTCGNLRNYKQMGPINRGRFHVPPPSLKYLGSHGEK
jgi:hypothetical protein